MTSGVIWTSLPVQGWSKYFNNLNDDNNPFDNLEIKGHHEPAFGLGSDRDLDSNHIRLFHYGANWFGSDDAGLIKFSIKEGFKVQISLIPETYSITESKYFDSPFGYKWNFCELDSFKEGGLYRSNSPPPRRQYLTANGRIGYNTRYYSCMTFEMVHGDELVLDVADDFRGSDGVTEVYKLTVGGGRQDAGYEFDDDIDVNVVVSITGVSRIGADPQAVADQNYLSSMPKKVSSIINEPTYFAGQSLSFATLRRGNRGYRVEKLQRLLKLMGLVEDVDGIFGKKTEAAVIRLQTLMVNYGGYAPTRYENGVFNPILYQDVKNFDSSNLTISDCKIKTLEQYHTTADPRDPFSALLIAGNHSFNASGSQLNLETASTISMKIRDN